MSNRMTSRSRMATRARRVQVRNDLRRMTRGERLAIIDTRALVIALGNQLGLVLLENVVLELVVKGPAQAQSAHTGPMEHELVYAVRRRIHHLAVLSFLPTVGVGGYHRLAYVAGVGAAAIAGCREANQPKMYSSWSRISIASPPPFLHRTRDRNASTLQDNRAHMPCHDCRPPRAAFASIERAVQQTLVRVNRVGSDVSDVAGNNGDSSSLVGTGCTMDSSSQPSPYYSRDSPSVGGGKPFSKKIYTTTCLLGSLATSKNTSLRHPASSTSPAAQQRHMAL
jgi:hypothetical protein